MKKGGIVAAIVFISIFIILFFGVRLISDGLPELEFGNIYDFNFDNSSSTEDETYITAKLNISNPNDNYLTINISFENLKCKIFYNKQEIGSIILNKINDSKEGTTTETMEEDKGEDNIDKKIRRVFTTIEGGKQEHFKVIFNFSNEAISEMLYNHTMKNFERGIIKFNLNFTSYIVLPYGYEISIEENIEINVKKEINTDFLEKINFGKYNSGFPEIPLVNYSKIETSAVSMFKNNNSNTIQINFTTRFIKKIIPLIDLYIGDSCYWIINSESSNINLGQEIIFYGKPLELMLLNLFLPIDFQIIANNEIISNCSIKNVERNYGLSNLKRIELPITIKTNQFSRWINSHINNNDSTTVYITNITFRSKLINNLIQKNPRIVDKLFPTFDESYRLFSFNFSPSDLIDEIELEELKFDLRELEKDLLGYQLLILVAIINTIIVVIVLYFSFWKKGRYLIFK